MGANQLWIFDRMAVIGIAGSFGLMLVVAVGALSAHWAALAIPLFVVSAALGARFLRRTIAAATRSREGEERLRVTLRSIGDAVIATDLGGAVVFINPVAEAATGWTFAAAVGRPLHEVFRVIDEATRAMVESPAARVLREGRIMGLATRTLLLARDGRELAIEDSGAPITNRDGAVVGVVLVFRDVSAKRAAEEDRLQTLRAEAQAHQEQVAAQEREELLAIAERARAEAERASLAKDQFLAMLSHELRSPLAAMVAWLGILRRRPDDRAMVDRALEVIERNVWLQSGLIAGLLDVSRIAAGKLHLDTGDVDLKAELAVCLDTLQPAADAKSITIERSIGAGSCVVLGDAARLGQVYRNLVENALKFTPTGGTIRINLARLDDAIEIAVTDSGEGFPPELGPALFEPFRQGTQHRNGGQRGLGLGLTIVRHLVEAHGGSILASSPGPGLGATFTARLPLGEADVPQPASGAPVSPDAGLQGLRVLIVEDQVDWREPLALHLARHGTEVTTAATSAEARSPARPS